jgi:hypothetical protein
MTMEALLGLVPGAATQQVFDVRAAGTVETLAPLSVGVCIFAVDGEMSKPDKSPTTDCSVPVPVILP